MRRLDRGSALEFLARAAFDDFDELNAGMTARGSSLRRFDAWCNGHEAKSDAEIAALVVLKNGQDEQEQARIEEQQAANAVSLCDAATAIEWPQWKILPQVRLWEAIALVVGVNPKSLKPVRTRGWSRPYFDGFIWHEQEARFHEALEFVERAALGPDAQLAAIAEAPIDLKKVATFFVRAGWSGMSAEMLLMGQSEMPPTTPGYDFTPSEASDARGYHDLRAGPVIGEAHRSHVVTKAGAPRVRWRQGLAELLPRLEQSLGQQADVHQILRFLKQHGKDYGVSPHAGGPAGFVFTPDRGAPKTLKLATLANAVAELRATISGNKPPG